MSRLASLIFLSSLLSLTSACATKPPGPSATASTTPAPAKGDDTFDHSIPATSPALSRLDVPASELPRGLTMGLGDPRCQSVQPLTFYLQPAMVPFVPKPLARRAEVVRRGTQLVGSVLAFEYAPSRLHDVRLFLDTLLWGEEGVPTEMHPEEIATVGDNLLVILCFDPRDDAGTWYKDRLRQRLGARVPRQCPAVNAFLTELRGHSEAELAKLIPATLPAHREALMACSSGAALVANFDAAKKDYKAAELGYRRALELDAAGDVLQLGPDELFSLHDGLALSVAQQGRVADSVPLFESSEAFAKASGSQRAAGLAAYNLACAYAETARFADAAKALERAIAIDPKQKDAARTDSSFVKARDREEFRRLLQ